MRLKLHLHADSYPVLPVNYQYPLSAVIYKILDRADHAYAAFLHESGYSQAGSLKGFKFFTYSDIKTPFKIVGDRLQLLTNDAELIITFYLPQVAEKFIKGLFQDQHVEIADKKSQGKFFINRVEVLPVELNPGEMQEPILLPISPIVSGKKNEKGNYTFLAPEHPEFVQQLMHNWQEKYKTVNGTDQAEAAFAHAGIEVIFYHNPPKSRLITIKADTDAETKIRGFTNFRLKVWGSREALELLLNAGVGIYNSLGMGCVDAVK